MWLAALSACQPPNTPPETPVNAPVGPPEEPAPLPTEQQSPVEAPPEGPPAREPKPAEPGIAPTGAPTRGTLPKAVIDEKLKAATPAVQACYARALKTKPELRGSVVVNFVVGSDGKVAYAEAVEEDDALADAPTVECILNEIRKLVFPEPNGGRVFINYPFKLESAKHATP